jgi:4-hydroxy-tetrahydrodipicolinate synthase
MQIANGVYPTMVTPFTADNRIDYPALEAMVEWYIARGVNGLFAVCQSSEMFYLSLRERAELARAVVRMVDGRVDVIASGHISDSLTDQAEEIKAVYDSGARAVVLVSNRLAAREESDDVFKRNLDILLHATGEIPFGFYECPHPYKRLFSPELLRHVAHTGRFHFLKDTCCDMEQIKQKLAAVAGTPLKIYNANSVLLLDSLLAGCAGFSGVMGNFHPHLYRWLCDHPTDARAPEMQDYLGTFSSMEGRQYPASAKYSLQLEGLPLGTHSRAVSGVLTGDLQQEVGQLRRVVQRVAQEFGLQP